jgi:hypothetical protein
MAYTPSLPSNGQPIDTQYIYDIVRSLIEINTTISSTGESNIQDYPSQKTSELNVQAQTINIVNSENVTDKSSKTGQVSFKTQFGQIPIVTATLVSRGSNVVKANLTITGVDSSAVYYKIDFTNAGLTTLDINVIAVGV